MLRSKVNSLGNPCNQSWKRNSIRGVELTGHCAVRPPQVAKRQRSNHTQRLRCRFGHAGPYYWQCSLGGSWICDSSVKMQVLQRNGKNSQFTTRCKGNKVIALTRQISLQWNSNYSVSQKKQDTEHLPKTSSTLTDFLNVSLTHSLVNLQQTHI